ncbi:hypothetical protein Hanom_Chr03g00236401 [Helianthus anomalus]
MICLATSAEDTTMVDTNPSLSCMMGPYLAAKSLSTRCGEGWTSWCMLPIKGRVGGPGMGFSGPFFRRKKMKIENIEISRDTRSMSMFEFKVFDISLQNFFPNI